jgi:hypothetical protein
MTFKEVEERFLIGEKLVKLFYTRKVLHEIGNTRITEKQFKKILADYETIFSAEYGMVTKHCYTFKQN